MRSAALLMLLTTFSMWGCDVGDMAVVFPEVDVGQPEPRTDVAVGAEATRRALVAISDALANPTTRSVRSTHGGRSLDLRDQDLLVLKSGLESRLDAQLSNGLPSSCVVHDDADFARVFTIVGIDDDSSHLFGYTETTKTTQIDQSAYLQVDPDHAWPDYDYDAMRARGTKSVSCDYALAIGLEVEYEHDTYLYGEAIFDAYGETTHMIPNSTVWTHDIQSYWHRQDDDEDGGEH